jgi:HEAT repeat protein
MPLTLADVRNILSAEEPNYPQAAQLGTDLLPHLAHLACGPDLMFATKAVYLASLIPHPQALEILEGAVRHEEPLLRVAAATGISHRTLEEQAVLLPRLLRDVDLGVRKTALQKTQTLQTAPVREAVKAMSRIESNASLRERASQLLQTSK